MELVKKHEVLRKRVKDQEETFNQFQMMVDSAGGGNDDAVKKLNKIISLQVNQFEKIMGEFGSMASMDKPEKKTAARPRVVKKNTPAPKTRAAKKN